MVEKYIKIYHKRNIKVALICSIPPFILLFIVSLFSDDFSDVILTSFFPVAVAALWVAVASMFTIRFKKMIEKQEQLYNASFQDADAQHLENTLYLSNDWLILSGSCAFYKEHIKSITSVKCKGYNHITIKTIDNKRYKFWCRSTSNVNKIKHWRRT